MQTKDELQSLVECRKTIKHLAETILELSQRIERAIMFAEARKNAKPEKVSEPRAKPGPKPRIQVPPSNVEEKLRIATYIEPFLAAQKVAPNTIAGYKSTLNSISEQSIKISPDKLKELMAERWKGLGFSTRKVKRSIVVIFFRWLKEEKLIDETPIKPSTTPRKRSGKVRLHLK